MARFPEPDHLWCEPEADRVDRAETSGQKYPVIDQRPPFAAGGLGSLLRMDFVIVRRWIRKMRGLHLMYSSTEIAEREGPLDANVLSEGKRCTWREQILILAGLRARGAPCPDSYIFTPMISRRLCSDRDAQPPALYRPDPCMFFHRLWGNTPTATVIVVKDPSIAKR